MLADYVKVRVNIFTEMCAYKKVVNFGEYAILSKLSSSVRENIC